MADDAFPMGPHLLKPYGLSGGVSHSQRVFNYRLSRARRISENAFGILSNRFRIFLGKIDMAPESAQYIVLAAVTLHNILRCKNGRRYIPNLSVDQENVDGTVRRGEWRQVGINLDRMASHPQRNALSQAKLTRQILTEYFMSTGAVHWQERAIQCSRRRTVRK